jgi:hypothetical protein
MDTMIDAQKHSRHVYNIKFAFEFLVTYLSQLINADGEMGSEEEEGDCYAWLEEITVPENLQMFVIKYLGPQVDDSSS